MKFEIKAGGTIEAATPTEVRDIHQHGWQHYWEERARGIKHIRFVASGMIAAGGLLIDDPAFKLGPESGFAWAVQRVSIEGLTGSDVVQVYRSPSPFGATGFVRGAFYGQIAAASYLHVGSKGIVLHGGERLAITGSSLTSTGQIVVNGEAVEAPEFKMFELL